MWARQRERAALAVASLRRRLRRKRPKCSCAEFHRSGRCKHAKHASEDVQEAVLHKRSARGGGVGSSGNARDRGPRPGSSPGGPGATSSASVPVSGAAARLSGQLAPFHGSSSRQSPSALLAPGSNDSMSVASSVSSATQSSALLVASPASGGSGVSRSRPAVPFSVPPGVKRLPGPPPRLLDSLDSTGDAKAAHAALLGVSVRYRAASEPHGIVMCKVVRSEAPPCASPASSPSASALRPASAVERALMSELEVLGKLKPHPHLVAFLGYCEVLGPAPVVLAAGGAAHTHAHASQPPPPPQPDLMHRQLCFEFAVDSVAELVSHRATAGLRLTPVEVRKYAIDVCEGLEALHALGIAHRDLGAGAVLLAQVPLPSGSNWAQAMRQHLRLPASGSARGGGLSADEHAEEYYDPSGDAPAPAPPAPRASLARKILRAVRGGGRTPADAFGLHLVPAQQQPEPQQDGTLENARQGPPLVAKIGNFAAARVLAAGERARTRVSAPQITAPEVWLRHAYGDAVDVWAVGILLYDMISRGERALDRMDAVQVEDAVLTKAFPPKQPLAPHEYRALEAVMRRCLAFNPANRPSASQLVAELKAIVPKSSSGLFLLNSA